jgi:hypothetical protein
MESARITVTRRDPRDVRDRQILASIDGQRVAELLFGDTMTREVAPGRHRLRVHNTLFWKTLELDLQPGEEARFIVMNRATAGLFAMLTFLGAAPYYLTVERQSE